MKSLKIAFGILLCVTILAVGASVVCAVIAGNTAEYFRDYRSSVTNLLSSLYGQLDDLREEQANTPAYKDALTEGEPTTDPTTQTEPGTDAPDTTAQSPEPPVTDAAAVAYTVRELDGRIGIYGEDGTLLRTVNVSVATLPRADREQLAVGITLTSRDELEALILDFSG